MTTFITIGSNQFASYGTIAAATVYFSAELTPSAVAWANATNAAKLGPALVSATRMIDRMRLAGTPAAPQVTDLSLHFPLVGTTVVPPQIVEASYLIAGQILVNPAFTSKTSTGSNVKRVDAGGGVGVTFFTQSDDTAPILPPDILALLAPFLGDGTTSTTSSSRASGTDYVPCDDSFGITDGL